MRPSADATAVQGPPLGAWLRLARWPNALIAAAGVIAGAWWAHGDLSRGAVWLAVLSATGLTVVANAANDLADVEIDRVAHPDRPLPRGELSMEQAERLAQAAVFVGAIAALLVDYVLGALALVVAMVMVVYSWRIKRQGLPGNVVVAVLASLPFLWGAWAAGDARAAAPLVLLAVPLHLAREIAKDLDDASGDAPVRRTLPVRYGPGIARGALLVALAAFAVVLAPFAAARPRFAIAVSPGLLLAAAGALRALRGRRGAPALLKLAMVWAIASLAAAR